MYPLDTIYTIGDLYYYNGELANGSYNGKHYADGVLAAYEVHMWKITGTNSKTCKSEGWVYNNYEGTSNSCSISSAYKIYKVSSRGIGNATNGSGGVSGKVNYTDGTYTATSMYARSTNNYDTETGRRWAGWETTAYFYIVESEVVENMSEEAYQNFVKEQKANKTYVYNTISLN